MKNIIFMIIGVTIVFMMMNYFSQPKTTTSTLQSAEARVDGIHKFKMVNVIQANDSVTYQKIENAAAQNQDIYSMIQRRYVESLFATQDNTILVEWSQVLLSQLRDFRDANMCQNMFSKDPKEMQRILSPQTQQRSQALFAKLLKNSPVQTDGSVARPPLNDDYMDKGRAVLIPIQEKLTQEFGTNQSAMFSEHYFKDCKLMIRSLEYIQSLASEDKKYALLYFRKSYEYATFSDRQPLFIH